MNAGQYVSIDGARTHYYEAGAQHRGARPTIVLLHSGEFGGCAEFSWEHNIDALATRYHVLAPDHLGFGRTDKIFDFENMMARRIRHIQGFIEAKAVGPVHVMGSSMSGGLCLMVAARAKPDWPLRSVTCCSGGGVAPDNPARRVLNSYDGSTDHMRRIIEVMFVDRKWADDENYIARRVAMANAAGAWEAIAAARFKAPFHQRTSAPAERDALDYAGIRVPVLVFAGRKDSLRDPGYTDDFVPKMPRAELHVFENAAHMGNIEYSDEFNARTLKFLAQVDGAC